MLFYRLELKDNVIDEIVNKGVYCEIDGRDSIYSKFIELQNTMMSTHGKSDFHRGIRQAFSEDNFYSEIEEDEDYSDFICGADSIDKLKKWFGDFYDELLTYDFVELVEYEVKQKDFLASINQDFARYANLKTKKVLK